MSGASGMNRDAVAGHNLPVSYGEGAEEGNKYMKYLGPGHANVKPDAYDKLRVQNQDLPDKYKGQNLYVRDTLDGFIMEDNEWYTTLALPWAVTDQLSVVWNEWRFNTVLAGRVPHE